MGLGRYLIKKAVRETRREMKRTTHIAMRPWDDPKHDALGDVRDYIKKTRTGQ